jgi:hypothetical protein
VPAVSVIAAAIGAVAVGGFDTHAAVYLVLSLLMLRYVDEALLPPFWRWIASYRSPSAM